MVPVILVKIVLLSDNININIDFQQKPREQTPGKYESKWKIFHSRFKIQTPYIT